jgi:hypothetical protein
LAIIGLINNLDKCKELIGKAKKGTLVYTDLPLVQKLDDPNLKLNLPNVTDKSQNILSCDYIDTSEPRGNSKDYIMSRLKRDAELGDEKAKEVEKKVREGKFTSARQVALEMGYRKKLRADTLPRIKSVLQLNFKLITL